MTPEEAAISFLGELYDVHIQAHENSPIVFLTDIFKAGVQWARENLGWISVKDRLPEEGVKVLVWGRPFESYPWEVHLAALTDHTFEVEIGAFKSTYSFASSDYPLEEVTHWLPLPPAPKEEE